MKGTGEASIKNIFYLTECSLLQILFSPVINIKLLN